MARVKSAGWMGAAMILLLSARSAFASEVISLQVTNQGDLYMLESENYLEASVQSVFQVLMDYDNYTRLSSVYQESRQMAPGPDGSPRVYTLARGCILFVCRSVEKVERLDTDPKRRIVATVIPELSNLQQGATEWVLSSDGDRYTTVLPHGAFAQVLDSSADRSADYTSRTGRGVERTPCRARKPGQGTRPGAAGHGSLGDACRNPRAASG